MSVPHGVLQELRQDVVQRHGDEWEAGCHVAIDTNTWGVAILVLTEASAGGGKACSRTGMVREAPGSRPLT